MADPISYDLTVAPKGPEHWFKDQGSKMAYQINGRWVPILHLAPGRRYRFRVNAPTHPFYLTTSSEGGGGNYPGSVMSRFGGVPTDQGQVDIQVPVDMMPGTILYGQCGNHPRMGFFIYIYPYDM